jgi:hypothetical protein
MRMLKHDSMPFLPLYGFLRIVGTHNLQDDYMILFICAKNLFIVRGYIDTHKFLDVYIYVELDSNFKFQRKNDSIFFACKHEVVCMVKP